MDKMEFPAKATMFKKRLTECINICQHTTILKNGPDRLSQISCNFSNIKLQIMSAWALTNVLLVLKHKILAYKQHITKLVLFDIFLTPLNLR